METRTCQNCKTEFEIADEDLNFYNKIKVPPPTFCPECRAKRRLLFRNERNLYRRKCDKTGENIISIYTQDSKYKVFGKDYWYSDKFDAMEYGIEIDWDKPFLEQFQELLLKVPLPSLGVRTSENCEYNNDMSESKDCYLCTRTHRSQKMLYTYRGNSSSDCTDCFQVVEKSELLYESVECIACSRSQYLFFCDQCVDSYLLYNCQNLMNCFMCANLRNKQYCIMNEQYTREGYFDALKEIDLGDRETREKLFEKFKEFILSVPRKNLTILNAPKCTGDNIIESNNCKNCYGIKECESSKYLLDIMKYKDSMDAYSGGRNSELIYEATAVAACSRTFCSFRVHDSHDISYSLYVQFSSNIFGSIGLKHKEYCILNKQYTKEQYKELVPKIIKHMNDMPYVSKVKSYKVRKVEGKEIKEEITKEIVYKYGEFFPESFSPFAYNETTAQEYYPLEKEEILKKGYQFRESEEKNYKATLEAENLPNNIKEVEDSILDNIIGCSHRGNCNHQCTTAFRIIKSELDFYRRLDIPLPNKCPNCRHYERLKFRNPIRLWHRKCMKEGCSNEFETSYSPDRPEIVYCKQCYQQEVY